MTWGSHFILQPEPLSVPVFKYMTNILFLNHFHNNNIIDTMHVCIHVFSEIVLLYNVILNH